MTTSNKLRIRPHSAFVVSARMPLAGVWIGIRFLLIPVLWLRYRLGSRMDWAFATDSFMKRLFFPLTEGADDTPRNEVDVRMNHLGQLIYVEDEGVGAGCQTIDLRKFANGRPLLLILFRGSWCPYSRLHLTDLSTAAQELEEMGVAVLAVSARMHDAWWRSKGICFTFRADPEGDLFRAMGVRIEPSLSHRVWGMLLPHESVFLFDQNGSLVVSDVRRLNSTKTKQKFLSATKWLAFARELVDAPVRRDKTSSR